MKIAIEGFNQEYVTKLKKEITARDGKTKIIKIDCTDLVILRWFVDFFPQMKTTEIDGKRYAWLNHKKVLNDLPILDISKQAMIDRMKKLVEFGILDYKYMQEGGSFSLYSFGENYVKLITQNEYIPYVVNYIPPIGSTTYPLCSQLHTKDKTIKDNTTIDNNKKNYNKKSEIVEQVIAYMNEIAGTSFKATTKKTISLINARLDEGFDIEELKDVIWYIHKKWYEHPITFSNGVRSDTYYRPETIFSTKFESYLQQYRDYGRRANQ